ncbi:unnamed protein product [marine sediment metagenome]|uniref:Uncharacterized protein n=1 Tax=marine sediment metagenome TaxID=412755 RepID=X1EHF4_9ZZZZ
MEKLSVACRYPVGSLSVSVKYGLTVYPSGRNTLSENGKGNAEDIIEFDTLDLDEYKSGSNKITELQDFLKKTLKPDKYSARALTLIMAARVT